MAHQMEILIREATERVASRGREAELPDIMLAGFGYLAHEIQKPQWYSIKRVVPIAFAAGAMIAGGIAQFVSAPFNIIRGN